MNSVWVGWGEGKRNFSEEKYFSVEKSAFALEWLDKKASGSDFENGIDLFVSANK